MTIGPSSATLNNDTRTLILQNLPLADVVKMREVSRDWNRSASSPRAYQHLSDITAEAIQLNRKDLKNIRRAERVANQIHEIFVAMMDIDILPLCYRKEDASLVAQQFTQDPIELDKFQPNHPSARSDRVCAGLDLEKGVNPFQDETTKMLLIRNLLLFEIPQMTRIPLKLDERAPLAGFHRATGIVHPNHFVQQVVLQYEYYSTRFCSWNAFQKFFPSKLLNDIRQGTADPIWLPFKDQFKDRSDSECLTTLFRECTQDGNWQLRFQFVRDVLHRKLILNPLPRALLPPVQPPQERFFPKLARKIHAIFYS